MEDMDVKRNTRAVFMTCIGVVTEKCSPSLIDCKVISSCMEATGRIVAAIINNEKNSDNPCNCDSVKE